jgi:general secretion pathway protein I
MSAARMSSGGQHGFTLLEVLIALAIVALSVGALLGTVTSSASNVIYLRNKTLAEWVALNRLTEIRIAKLMPDKGKRTGNAEMGGQRWQWEEEVVELPVKGMFRIDVRARPTGETVNDTKPVAAPSSQTVADSKTSGDETNKLSWSAQVTGVMSNARSDLQTAVGAPLTGTPTSPGPGLPAAPKGAAAQ